MNNSSFGKGIFFALLAFTVWGILPLYWRLLAAVDSIHILSFRILFSLALVGLILTAKKNFLWISVFREPKKGGILILTALTLSVNWGLYIWAVNKGHTIEASLGYYMNPVVAIVLGLIFLREKLKALQWAAFGIACLGVLVLGVLSGGPPWISLGLALTFSAYGLLKKALKLSALEYLGAETLAAAPLGLFLLLFTFKEGSGFPRIVFNAEGLSNLAALPLRTWILLALAGVASAIPLFFFTLGAKMLPLSTLGFTQVLSPTIQFMLGFFIFGEYFPGRYFFAVSLIWLAVILYVVSLKNPRKAGPSE